MQCPKCKGRTRPVRARRGVPETGDKPIPTGDLELDRCGSCHGTWYDRKELDQLLGRDVSGQLEGFRRAPTHRTVCLQCGSAAPETGRECSGCKASLDASCPRCSRGLEAIRVAGIELDVCPACAGLWLDQSEALALAAIFSLRPEPASTGITCIRCGRSRLRPAEVMCSEDGFVCDGCHRAADAALLEAGPDDVTFGVGKRPCVADLLLNLVGSVPELPD
jgi:Zn-finger nucleic acid-binding protein